MDRSLLLVTLIILGIWGSPLMAQADKFLIQDNPEYQYPSVQPAQGILWEVSGKDLTQPSYIYAVLHVVPRAQFFIPPPLDSLLELTERIVMEVNPNVAEKDYLFRSEVPIDSTLDNLLSRRDFRWLEDFIEDELTEDSKRKLIQRYPPLILLRQMMCDYCLYRHKGKEAVFYEKYLRSATKDIPFTTLEMEWIRLAWLDSHSFQDQSRMLIDKLSYRQEQKAAYEGMLRAYRQQNLDRVWLLSQDSPDLGDNGHTMLDLRVANWKGFLEENMANNSLCAVVPSIVLPGEYGLLHLLRKNGYTVKSISY